MVPVGLSITGILQGFSYLEDFGVFSDAGDVVERGDVVRGVLWTIPRERLGDSFDPLVGLVQTDVLGAQLLDGG